MNYRSLFLGLLSVALTGCFRVTITRDLGGNGSEDLRVSVQRKAEGTVPAEVAAVTIQNEFGPVTVTGVEEGFGWNWELTCWGKDTAAAQERSEKLRLEATPDGRQLRLKLANDLGANERGRFESKLVVRVPKAASLEVQNAFGEVAVAALNGSAAIHAQHGKVTVARVSGRVTAATAFAELAAEDIGTAELTNQNGSIRAVNVAGPLVARTSFASLTAQGVRGRATLRNQNGALEVGGVTGDLDAETSFSALRVKEVGGAADLRNQNGEIEARNVAGPIHAQTAFARMELDGASPVFDARNQNGAIRIVVRSETVEQIDAATSFSPVEIQLPAHLKPLIRAETSFGKIHSDLPVLVWSSISDAAFRADTARPKLTLRTQIADIVVRQSPGP